MGDFEEQIVREFFELHGFSVRHRPRESNRATVDLEVFNPEPDAGQSLDFMLFPNQLSGVRQARVLARGWKGYQRYSAAQLSKSESILHFIEGHILKGVGPLFPEGDSAADTLNILLLPSMPTKEPVRTRAIELLRPQGVHGVLSFLSVLRTLIGRVERFSAHTSSDTLRLLRILKSFDLLKNQQLEIDYGDQGR